MKDVKKYGLWYSTTTILLFTLFPKHTIGNIYLVSLHLVICLVFLFFIYCKKSPTENKL